MIPATIWLRLLPIVVLLVGCTATDRQLLNEPPLPAEGHSSSETAPPVASEPRRYRPDGSPPSELDQAAAALARASAGSEEAAEEALRLARAAAESSPHDSVVAAYLGAATAIQARYSASPFAKLAAAREGVELLDQAVTAAPDDPEVRFLRASATFPMPAFLGRRAQTAADLEWLTARAVQDAAQGSLTARMAAISFLYHGFERREAGDLPGARTAWRIAVDLAPGSTPSQRAREQLASLDV